MDLYLEPTRVSPACLPEAICSETPSPEGAPGDATSPTLLDSFAGIRTEEAMGGVIDHILSGERFTVVEAFQLPPREARVASIPAFLFASRVGCWLENKLGGKGRLWTHQAAALERIGAGQDVVVSTGTASGKSLVFRAAALHLALTVPHSRVVVFYPLKALAADQWEGWVEAAADLGLGAEAIGRIDGSVPMAERASIVSRSRILLMTPDVCHAWAMGSLAAPAVKELLRNLRLVVLDEAHTLEGVFGSNFAFLFRRLQAARAEIVGSVKKPDSLRVIAATATIASPAEHLERLTGHEFTSVGEAEDGSPHYGRRCVHVACAPGDEMSVAKEIHVRLLAESRVGGFITFADSRKAVELLSVASNRKLSELLNGAEVWPYRAGFHREDRRRIEQGLKRGTLRGVVSTSALELGIDLPHLQVGLNLGVPATRKSYRQRLGRVGRSGPGTFVVIAEPTAFTRYGTTYRQYHDMSVEPSHLYLDNRFMQYAQARCLADELESLGVGARTSLPCPEEWPEGFDGVFQAARPGGDRPREFDAVAMLGGDCPQRNYPLRNVGEVNFRIGLGEQDEAMGEATLGQALRECYPGATYFHMARAYKVQAWRTGAFQPYIKVKAVAGASPTKPRLRTWIRASLTPGELVERRLRKNARGFLAECHMQITERVEGYTDGENGQFHAYQELREKNPNLRPRMRQFRTTGVVLCIDEPWFRNGERKQLIVDLLRDLFCREYSVLSQDVGAAATNIAITTEDGQRSRSDCLVIFDQTYGSLRLTERVYLNFIHLLNRMCAAVGSLEAGEQELYRALADQLREFAAGLPEVEEAVVAGGKLADLGTSGPLQVFAPGSVVGLREKGALFTDVCIIEPTIMADGGLYYRVKCRPVRPGVPPVKRWVNAECLEPSADVGEWSYSLWDAETQEYADP
jgi:DEAD/DEAH box helicase domain-containing protein